MAEQDKEKIRKEIIEKINAILNQIKTISDKIDKIFEIVSKKEEDFDDDF